MKARYLGLGLILMMSVNACNHAESVDPRGGSGSQNPVEATDLSTEGGISGGGGGTLPADPATSYEISNIIANAKTSLRLLLNLYDTRQFPILSKKLDQKLFLGPIKLQEVMEATDIDVQMNGPCYDSGHHPVDGSIYANRPNSICISVFRISPKVDRQVARSEVQALILHELSHLLGATEPEAVEFQKRARKDLSDHSDKKDTDFLEDSKMRVDGMEAQLESLSNFIKPEAAQISQEIEQLNNAVTSLGEMKSKMTEFYTYQRILSERELSYLELMWVKLYIAKFYLLCHSTHPAAQEGCERYETSFQSKEEITLDEYYKNDGVPGMSGSPFARTLIRRLHSQEELSALTKQMAEYVGQVHRRLFSLISVQTPSLILIPEDGVPANPWLKAVGKYTATVIDCPNTQGWTMNIVGVEITNQNGAVILNRLTSNGNAPVDLTIGEDATVSIGETNGVVYRKETRGDLWYFERVQSYSSAYQLDLTTLKLTSINDDKTNFNTETQTPFYQHRECSYQLAKTP